MGHDRLIYLSCEEDDEDDEDVHDAHFYSGRNCDGCGDDLHFTDEVFLLEVVEGAKEGGQLFIDALRDSDGEYLFSPYVLHLECWEDALEAMSEATSDQPPMSCPDDILECICCQSDIGSFEPFISVTFGEIRVSPRAPSRRSTATITRLRNPQPLCVACISHITEDHFCEWEELIEMFSMEPKPGDDDE